MKQAILEIAEEIARLSIQFNTLQNRLAAIAVDQPEKAQTLVAKVGHTNAFLTAKRFDS
jgi:hypothetical protein